MENPEPGILANSVISPQFMVPSWPAPSGVLAASTTRVGGNSVGPFADFNLGTHVGDNLQRVEANRHLLREQLQLPAQPLWLEQVHGCDALYVESTVNGKGSIDVNEVDLTKEVACPVADAVWTDQPGVVLTIMTADCLPVLLASRCGLVVAAIHGGWRGLASGILQKTVAMLPVPAGELVAWMGPAIGPDKFEVGGEVRDVFLGLGSNFSSCFKPSKVDQNKCYADIFAIAKQCLSEAGVASIYSDQICTVSDERRFFSHRRDNGVSGRMATLIWRI